MGLHPVMSSCTQDVLMTPVPELARVTFFNKKRLKNPAKAWDFLSFYIPIFSILRFSFIYLIPGSPLRRPANARRRVAGPFSFRATNGACKPLNLPASGHLLEIQAVESCCLVVQQRRIPARAVQFCCPPTLPTPPPGPQADASARVIHRETARHTLAINSRQ